MKPRFRSVILAICIAVFCGNVLAQEIHRDLEYQPAPVDNPLKGLVPYAASMPWFEADFNSKERQAYFKEYRTLFPHSMEFHYFGLSDLMIGDNKFDWSELEKWLEQTSARGCQLTFRIYLEYPNKKSGVPKFLLDQGLKIKKWKHDGEKHEAPDYRDPRLRKAVDQFVAALGKKYDADPRIGCITMGMLGHWGEWHSYPKSEELFPGKEYQKHLMDQFAKHFSKTQVLMRYPAGEDHYIYASNADSTFGYHDDSFAWATIKKGKEDDDWFFQAIMEEARTLDAWKTRMIGGEIRPEVWGCVFDDNSCAPKGQEFNRCVQQTHVSWLLDSGMFGEGKGKARARRYANAIREVTKTGYELQIQSITIKKSNQSSSVELQIRNRGVAPFYYDWPATIAVIDKTGNISSKTTASLGVSSILPSREGVTRRVKLTESLTQGDRIGIRIANPMPEGKPLRFANHEIEIEGELWVATGK